MLHSASENTTGSQSIWIRLFDTIRCVMGNIIGKLDGEERDYLKKTIEIYHFYSVLLCENNSLHTL